MNEQYFYNLYKKDKQKFDEITRAYNNTIDRINIEIGRESLTK